MCIRDRVFVAHKGGLQCHIGVAEQRAYRLFKKFSVSRRELRRCLPAGVGKDALRYIEQIDTVWLDTREKRLIAVFEVEMSTSIDSGINRFRNLFAVVPQEVKAFIVVPNDREREVRRKLASPANRKDSITSKVRYILAEDLKWRKPEEPVDVEAIAKRATD